MQARGGLQLARGRGTHAHETHDSCVQVKEAVLTVTHRHKPAERGMDSNGHEPLGPTRLKLNVKPFKDVAFIQ